MTHVEHEDGPGVAGAGLFDDPLAPGRRRHWDGAVWTARVSDESGPPAGLSWTPTLAELPPPTLADLPPPAPPGVAAPAEAPARPPLVDGASAVSWGAGRQSRTTPPPPLVDGASAVSWGAGRQSRTTPPPSGPVLVFHAATGTATPGPAAAGTTPAPPAAPPARRAVPAPIVIASLAAADPMRAAFGDETRPPPEAEQRESHRRRRLAPVAIAAAAALIVGAAVSGAGILRSDDQRPQLLPEQSYRDDRAGFTVRYPDAWQVLRRDEGDGIRFAVGARDASGADTNTVSVVVGTEAAALPELHTLADQLTETLREELPGVRLATATRTRLVDAPAFRLVFRDPESTPPTRIEQFVGRTISGRPLTVTITIREPRTAPTPQELQEFVGSLDPS